jgi:hypothetical protein
MHRLGNDRPLTHTQPHAADELLTAQYWIYILSVVKVHTITLSVHNTHKPTESVPFYK